MTKHLMVALTNAVEGQETELRNWYQDQHLTDLLAVPGIVSAKIYDVSMMKDPGGLTFQNLAVYEIDADDPQQVIAESTRRMGTQQMPRSSALDSDRTLALLASPRGTTV